MALTRRDQDKIKQLLIDSLNALCKSNLNYDSQFSIEGLLGITLDERDVILVKVDETIRGPSQDSFIEKGSQDSVKLTEVVQSAKRGRPARGKTRGRGRGRPPGSGRKRSTVPAVESKEEPHPVSLVQSQFHPGEGTSGDTQEQAKEPFDSDDDTAVDHEESESPIKDDPDGINLPTDNKQETTTPPLAEQKDGEQVGDSLDSETNKNLSSFLDNLISAHSTSPEDAPASCSHETQTSRKRAKRTTAAKSRWTPPQKKVRLPRELTGPIKRKRYPESAIKEAIRLVKEEKYSMRAASLATGCPPSTLHRRFFQEELKKSGNKPILTPHGEETLCNYIRTRLSSGQKVTAAWAMGLAAILAKNDGIKFKTQHGGPSFGWWMRFKTRHPELGLLNKEGQSSTAPSTASQSSPVQSQIGISSMSNIEKKDILHVAAAEIMASGQDREKQTTLGKQLDIETQASIEKQLVMERHQSDVGKEMDMERHMDIERQMYVDRQSNIDRPTNTDRQDGTERQPNVNFMGQIYF